MVPVRVSDPGPPLQELPRVEVSAEDDVGNGQEGNGKVKEQVENSGPLRGPAVQSGDPGFLGLDAGGTEGTRAGRGRR